MIGEILALSAAICWAVAAILYKRALKNISYLAVNLVRSVFAALLLLVTLPTILYQSSTITFNQLALIIIASVIGLVMGDTFYFIGLKKIGVSRAQSISSSYPLYSMLLAVVFLNEELTLSVVIGTPLIVAGIAIVSLSQREKNNTASNGEVTLLGVASSIVASVFWGIGLVVIKVALSDGSLDPVFATFISRMALVPFLFIAVVAAGESSQIRRLTKIDITVLGVAGMLSLGIGGIFLFLSLALIDASIAIPLSSITPFLSIILASLYVKEKVKTTIVIGALLIIIGVTLLSFYA